MEEIRDKFHDLINYLNQICITTSTTAEIIRMKKFKDQTDPAELKKLIEESIEALEDSNRAAIEAANMVKCIKKITYESLDIEKK